MVRNYTRKRQSTTDPEDIRKALEHYINSADGYLKTANLFNIPRTTLQDHVKKFNKLSASEKSTSNMSYGYQKPRQVFTNEQETTFVAYLKHASSIFFGLCPRDVRVLAFECGRRFNIPMPLSWAEREMAGADWFSGFLKRHKELSIRTPEATSIARATAFNRINVSSFFLNLANVMDRHQFDACSIWNIDETGVTTAIKPSKIVAGTGVKQVGSLSSAERGQLVTLCAAVSASGQCIPPFLVYPRVHFKDYFLKGAPPGTKGTTHQSGWMTGDNFLLFLQHFCHHVKPSKEKPVLMLLDNHNSHLTIECLDFAKQNCITMLSFPPHCSHRLQPLDISVFGPLKKKLSQSQSNWLRSNPGKPITIYDIASILCEPWKEALTMSNICSGFEKTGIYPFHNGIFSDDQFAPADVTDRPNEATDILEIRPNVVNASIPSGTSYDTDPEMISYLHGNNLSIIPVRGDGHCLLHAISSSLHAEEAGTFTCDDLGSLLINEVRDHNQFYRDFCVEGDRDVSQAVYEFLMEKQYNNNACDIFLSAFCNAMNMKAVVVKISDGAVNTLEVLPSRPGVDIQRTSYLTLHGTGCGAHYNAATCRSRQPTTISRPTIPERQQILESSSSSKNGETFSPETIKPHPKAPKRSTTKNRKRRKTCILTDTPEREALRAERKQRNINKKRVTNHAVKKSLFPKKSVPKETEDSETESEEDFCLVCLEPWSNSRSREKWIQCSECKMWAHELCADTYGMAGYVCHNCDSDE